MRLVIFLCIGLGALLSALSLAVQKDPKQTGSLFVGTWQPENKKTSGLKVQIEDSVGKLNIQVWYLGTYAEYKPWPKSALVTFRDGGKKSPEPSCAMASWTFDTGYETWIIRPEKQRLRIEMYTKFTDGRPNVYSAEYFRKSH